MAERNRPHIFLPGQAEREPYRPPARRIEPRPLPSPSNRANHAATLRSELEGAESEGSARRSERGMSVEGSISGIYVAFESFPGLRLALESLDPQAGRIHPELRSVHEVETDGQVVEEATVFIPDRKLGHFLRRIQGYLETADNDKPRNRNLLDRVRSIGLASLSQLWTDPPEDFPTTDELVWWEVWLRRRDGEIDRLKAFATRANFQVGPRTLVFSNRVVALVRAAPSELATALDVLDDLAELRRPRAIAAMLSLEYAGDQAEWVKDLEGRTVAPPEDGPAACILDTGIHQAHPLLSLSLNPEDCHSCDPNWPGGDHHGHGTEMAGLALYGDVGEAILANGPIRLRHRLESVKLLPR